MIDIYIKKEDEYIKLGQLLKKAGIASSGTEAKYLIEEGMIQVNGEVAFQRGKKITEGDVVTFEEETYRVIK